MHLSRSCLKPVIRQGPPQLSHCCLLIYCLLPHLAALYSTVSLHSGTVTLTWDIYSLEDFYSLTVQRKLEDGRGGEEGRGRGKLKQKAFCEGFPPPPLPLNL